MTDTTKTFLQRNALQLLTVVIAIVSMGAVTHYQVQQLTETIKDIDSRGTSYSRSALERDAADIMRLERTSGASADAINDIRPLLHEIRTDIQWLKRAIDRNNNLNP